jgi:hypothetical protein
VCFAPAFFLKKRRGKFVVWLQVCMTIESKLSVLLGCSPTTPQLIDFGLAQWTSPVLRALSKLGEAWKSEGRSTDLRLAVHSAALREGINNEFVTVQGRKRTVSTRDAGHRLRLFRSL